MGEIQRQLERLRRHHTQAFETYDEISLLDLAHTLRLVLELKDELLKLRPKLGSEPCFQIGRPTGTINAAARNGEYVLCYLPGGVKSRAGNTQLGAAPAKKNNTNSMAMSIRARVNPPIIEMDRYCVIYNQMEDKALKAFMSDSGAVISRVTFTQYLAADAVRVAFVNHQGDYDRKIVSREVFAKAVANTLGGSHGFQTASDGHDNTFAEAVQYLLRYAWGGLPLPYFVVMKITKDILDAWAKE